VEGKFGQDFLRSNGGRVPRGLKSVRENSSFAPLGWIISLLHPRLTPWAVFFRRFAARNRRLLPP
jgi:hypothetical protein